MSSAAFISGDWGTSRLRLFLCGPAGQLLDQKEGPGAAGLREDMGAVLARLAEPWDKAHGKLPAILCGMVGSSIGWREVPYLPCPAQPETFAKAALQMTSGGRQVALLPGLACRNGLDMPDMMRGEETQIAGALQLHAGLRTGQRLLCMPGTHTKWVVLDNGTVTRFQTALSGELYDLLGHHSVLLGGKGAAQSAAGRGFEQALETVRSHPEADLMHMLFSTRSRQLTGEFEQADAGSYLSGLLIGHDVAGARKIFQAELARADGMVLVGAPALAALYAGALKAFGLSVDSIDGDAASLAGLKHGYDVIFGKQTHAD